MNSRTPKNVALWMGLLIVFILATCKSSATKKETSESSIQDLVKSTLGDNVTTDLNASKTYSLIQQLQEPKDIGGKSVHFIVIRLSDTTIVLEGSFMRGYVKWTNDNTLEKFSVPGKVKPDQDMSVYKKLIKVDQSLPKL